MRLSTRLILSCCLVVTSLATAWLLIPVQLVTAVGNNSPADKNKSATVRARATVRGAPGSGIEGVVTFKERKGDFPEPGVEIVARVKGLTPGHHGMHIHEIANCSNVSPTGTIGAFLGAGGHFDPGPFGMSHPDANHPFHMGDIPNLEVNAGGVGHLTHTSSRITLSPGPLSVFDANGSAIIVHAGPDLGTTGVAGGSGGARLACGVIEQVSGGDKDDEN